METRKKVLGAEHPDTLTSMANLAFTWKGRSRCVRSNCFWGPFACKENSDENDVFDRIVPEAMSPGENSDENVPGGYLSLGRTRMTTFSASWSFNHAQRLAPNWLLSVFVKGDMVCEGGRFLGMAMTFPGAKLLPGRHRVFLGMGQMLLGKTHRFSNIWPLPLARKKCATS
jgi:hypothetical protein